MTTGEFEINLRPYGTLPVVHYNEDCRFSLFYLNDNTRALVISIIIALPRKNGTKFQKPEIVFLFFDPTDFKICRGPYFSSDDQSVFFNIFDENNKDKSILRF